MSEECVWLCCHRCATGLLLYVCMLLEPTPPLCTFQPPPSSLPSALTCTIVVSQEVYQKGPACQTDMTI